MMGLIWGALIIVGTNLSTAFVCIYQARQIIKENEFVYERLLGRRDREIIQLKESYELKFNKD